ncbi:MAG: succinate dehydrogenase cytochrome b subunit [Holophagaceae bacterium]|nr:succinate dehydrogenase cytochrome b subunit [Holophagaceae bacterium]
MHSGAGFFGSSVGKKIVMAVTGIMLIGFVVVHMAGNLQLYLPAHGGEHPLDAYGTFLRTLLHGSGIWIARAALLSAAGLHVWAAVGLTLMNRAARPIDYQNQQYDASTISSRWMRVSGVVVLVFIVFHLLHLTIGSVLPDFVHGQVFHNVVTGFQVPWVSAFYIIAMLCLATHIHHGIWSMLQTLGLSHPRFNGLRNRFATLLTIVVIGGNISFPIAVLTGFVR